MHTIKGFFFDLDGTLVDTHESNYRAYKSATKAVLNIELDSTLKRYIKSGASSNDFLEQLIPNITKDQIKDINEQKKFEYEEHLIHSKPNVELVGFLEQISKTGITVLVTTAKKSNAKTVLKRYNLEPLVDYIVFGEDVTSMKPDPEAYLLALKLTGLNENEVVAFEDSNKGIDAAHSAGIRTIRIEEFTS